MYLYGLKFETKGQFHGSALPALKVKTFVLNSG